MFISSNNKVDPSYRLLIALVILCALVSRPAIAKESNVIALFGDSITVGENDSFPGTRPDQGEGRIANDGVFPALPPSDKLDALLIKQQRSSTVVNWGRGGTSSSNGADRISSELAVSQEDFPADNYYVLILYGTNDFNAGLAESDTGFNISLMIDRARAKGFIPVIGKITPNNLSDVRGYNSSIVAAANSKSAPIVDHFSRFVQDGNNGLSLLDVENRNGVNIRLHPTSEGYDVIAETWFKQFLESAISPRQLTITPIITFLLDDQVDR